MAKECSGECLGCSLQQQIFCSSSRTFAIMENQRKIVERLDSLAAIVNRIAVPPEEVVPARKKTQISGGVDNRPDQP